MELPFLKGKSKKQGPGEVVTVNHSDDPNPKILIEKVAQELQSALERRDIKALRESLQALVLMIKAQDQDE